MVVEPTQPLTEMSTRYVSCGVKAIGRADDLAIYMCRLSRYVGTLRLLDSSAFAVAK